MMFTSWETSMQPPSRRRNAGDKAEDSADHKTQPWADLSLLKETVNRGKGLLMLGGFHTFGPADTPKRRWPTFYRWKWIPWTSQRLQDPIREDVHWPGPLRMQPTTRSMRHFALTLAAGCRRMRPPGQNFHPWMVQTASSGSSPSPRSWPRPRSSPTIRRTGRCWSARTSAGPRPGVCGRFHLAVVHAWFRVGPQAVLAANCALARTQGPVGRGRCLGAD